MRVCGVPSDTQVLGSECEADVSPVPPPRPRPQLSHETPLPSPTAPQMQTQAVPRGAGSEGLTPQPLQPHLGLPALPGTADTRAPTVHCRVSREKPDAAFGRCGRCALIGSSRPRGQRLDRSAPASPASKETAEGDWLQGTGRRDTLLPGSILLAGQFGAKLGWRKRRGGAQRWRRGGPRARVGVRRPCCVLVLNLFHEEMTPLRPRAGEAVGS